jgi:hypothetical protein
MNPTLADQGLSASADIRRSLAQSAFVDEDDDSPLFWGFFNLWPALARPLRNGFLVAFQSTSGW